MRGRASSALLLAAALAVAGGGDGKKSVRNERAMLREEPTWLAPPIAELRYGDRVEVLEEAPPWYRVRPDAGEKVGWLVRSDLMETKLVLGPADKKTRKAVRSGKARLAGRAFEDRVERALRAKKGELEEGYRRLDAAVAAGDAATIEELARFRVEGALAPFEPAATPAPATAASSAGRSGRKGARSKAAAVTTAGSALRDRDPDPSSLPGVGRTGFELFRAYQKITPEDELYLGRAVAARLLAAHPPLDDAAAHRYVNRVGRSLALASNRPTAFRGYRFLILDGDEANAFAAPGAFVLVTRGLLRLARDEDQLAAILAHELAHLEKSHGRALIEKNRWRRFWKVAVVNALAPLGPKVVADLAGALDAMAGGLYRGLLTRGYEEGQERAADAGAVALLARVGYDPRALLEVRRALAEARPEGYARSHQKPRARLRELEKTLPPPSPRPAARAERFRAAMASVIATSERR